MTHLSADAMPVYLNMIQTNIAKNSALLYRDGFEFLLKYVELWPEPLTASITQLCQIFYDALATFDTVSNEPGNADGRAKRLANTSRILDYSVQLLACLKPVKPDEPMVPATEKRPLMAALKKVALTGTPLQSKYAIRSIHRLFNPAAIEEMSTTAGSTITPTGDDAASKASRELLQDYVDLLKDENSTRLPSVFAALSELVDHYTPQF